MLAAAVVLLGSVAAAVVAVVAALLVLLRQVVGVVAQVPPEPLLLLLLLHLKPSPLPQVVVESEATLHLKGRLSFSAATARSSPPTVQPTYARAPSTR